MNRMKIIDSVGVLRVLLAVVAFGAASNASATVYRCPGPVLTYTDQLSPQQARERGCKAIEGAPVTVVGGSKPRPAVGTKSPAAAAAGGASEAPRASDTKVSDREQRERDKDARRILDEELRREEEKLAAMKKDFNNGEPERQGNERNYQRYLDRVAEMKQSIERKEADIASIRRELERVVGSSEGSGGGSKRPQ